MFGRGGPGKSRISWIKNLRTWYAKTTTEVFRAAVNKVVITRMIANIQREEAHEEEENGLGKQFALII